ncbi:hypothetical protein BJY01DRAFT_255014 [Aspergillus pseudoustus]|uniref:Uncharacterized protein n=1 Tax=Aspergillus pseudoustus TaxID=1810923 RepID=A0ABR4INM5_9EURO
MVRGFGVLQAKRSPATPRIPAIKPPEDTAQHKTRNIEAMEPTEGRPPAVPVFGVRSLPRGNTSLAMVEGPQNDTARSIYRRLSTPGEKVISRGLLAPLQTNGERTILATAHPPQDDASELALESSTSSPDNVSEAEALPTAPSDEERSPTKEPSPAPVLVTTSESRPPRITPSPNSTPPVLDIHALYHNAINGIRLGIKDLEKCYAAMGSQDTPETKMLRDVNQLLRSSIQTLSAENDVLKKRLAEKVAELKKMKKGS